MSIRIDVHHFFHPADEAILHRIEAKMTVLSDKVDELATHVADLKTAVATGTNQIVTVAQNVAVSMDGLAAQIADLKNQIAGQGVDQATLDKITALEASVDQIKTDTATGLQTASQTLTDAVGRDTTAG